MRLPQHRFARFATGLLLAACAACGAEEDFVEQDAEGDEFLADGKADAFGAPEGGADALAVLRLASTLDETKLASAREVGLGTTTARAIATWRVGPDRRAATADDEEFERLRELDAVPNVGKKAFERLLAYARANGHSTAAQAVCGVRRTAGDPSRLPADVRAAAPGVRARSASERIEIYASPASRASDAQIQEFRLRTCLALDFALRRLGLEASLSALSAPYRVVVLDLATYNAATGAPGTDGMAFAREGRDGDALVVPVKALSDRPELDDTLAHELHHVLAGRLAPNDAALPWYLVEGAAVQLGGHYGRAVNGRPVEWVKTQVSAAGADDARLVWQRYGLEDRTTTLEEIEHDQALSGFFVEHLRTKQARRGGAGFPDAQRRLFSVLRKVSGGQGLDAAFPVEFDGLALSRARTDFAAHLGAHGVPARYRGTIYE